jgi:hypothetical protein
MSSQASSPTCSTMASSDDPVPARSTPTARAMPVRTCSGWVTPASGTVPAPKRSRSRFPAARGQAGLADPTRPGEGHQPRIGRRKQVCDLVDGLLASHQQGGGHRQRTRAVPTRGPRRCRRRPRIRRRGTGGCEPLAQQRRQVLAPGPAGAPPPAPRSAYPAGPSVALPVQPHEDIALREIGPVEVLWGCGRAPSSNSTGVSRSAEMARATTRRSSASSPCSPTVELTNTRRRWSGVWITTSARILRSLIVPGRPTPVWDEPLAPAIPRRTSSAGTGSMPRLAAYWRARTSAPPPQRRDWRCAGTRQGGRRVDMADLPA